ncbi:MAG: hypothetical protein EXR69_02715 [Myxococcales bacterium]|nr:hypothetical protein [Myxococcales bacterium]
MLAPVLAIGLAGLAGCRRGAGSADDVCSFEFQEDKVSKDGRTVGTMIADDEGLYQIHTVIRWAEDMGDPGTAPIGVTLQGGWFHEGTPILGEDPHLDTANPVVDIHIDLPGAGLSGGTNDRRGPIAAAALASVLRWAHGEGVDAGGCSIQDRIPAANLNDIYLIGTSNGGNLAYSVLTDDSLSVPPIAGLVIWETPSASTFVNVELGVTPSVYTPGTCTVDATDGILCPFPAEQLISIPDDRVSQLCFDVDADGACVDTTDVMVFGSETKETGELMLSPALRRAADSAGLDLTGYGSLEDADAWWSYRDASRRVTLLVDRWPDLPILLVGSETDHVIDTWTDHPHIRGLGQALQEQGAFWTRLNPGAAWLPGNTTPNAPNLPLSLGGDEGRMLTEDAEDPLDVALTGAVLELSERNATGDWTSE